MQAEELDIVLAPGYLDGIDGRPLGEIRAMRAECVRLGDALSYVRRLVQGRIDLLELERRRRLEGGESDDLEGLVARLAGALADRTRPSGVGRLPERVVPPEGHDVFTAELDRLSSEVSGDLTALDDEGLDQALVALGAFERTVSDRRLAVFERVDRLQGELTRRYKAGDASVDGLLA